MLGSALGSRAGVNILHDASARRNVARWMDELLARKSVTDVMEEWSKV